MLPASVIRVSEWAFAECARLRYADLSAARGLKSLGSAAFHYCSRLRQVLLNEGLETICSFCFLENGTERITFPHTLRCIGDMAFASCSSLKQVCLANSALESIGEYAFFQSGLESFTAPPSLRTVGPRAFSACESLKHVDLSACLQDKQHDSVSISEFAFDSSGVQEIRLPRALRVIEERTFRNCQDLRSVTFPDGSELEEIREAAFQRSGLESFAAPPSLKKIGDMAFNRCPELKDFRLTENVQELGWLCLWKT